MNKETTALRRENRTLKTQASKYKLAVSAGIVFVIYVVLAIVFPIPTPNTTPASWTWPLLEPTGGALEFRMALGGALISFCAFGAIMEILKFKSMDQEVAGAMRQVFSDSVPLIEGFNNAKKRDFVENSLEALLGRKIGYSTYKYIEPMLKDGAGFREEFEYKVRVKNNPREDSTSEYLDWFPADRYRWIEETISYKLLKPTKSNEDDYDRGPFEVLFLFDKTSLEKLNPDQSIFARFLVELDEADLNKLFQLEESEIKKIIKEIIAPELYEQKDSGALVRLDYEPVLMPPEPDDDLHRCKPYFKLVMKDQLQGEEGTSKLRLEFTYPYRRSATHFIFTMPQPVYAPKLYFDYDKSDIDAVDYASYFSCDNPDMVHVTAPKRDEREYQVSVRDAWIFPTSGVTFVWQNPE
ncbi:MAG: hypothetical protein AB8B82_07225 [Roseovarius sp.]